MGYDHDRPLPPGHTNEVRSPPALVEHVLSEHTEPGARVIDPFAGYGTTLTVAEELDRVAYGLEYDAERVAYIRQQLDADDRVRQGDVLELDPAWFPACECCLTSSPFTERTDHRNPFRNHAGQSTYADYLDDVEASFARLESVMAAGGTVIVSVANLKHEGRVTPLAWDVARRLSNVFHFEGETVVTSAVGEESTARDGHYGYGYDHSYCPVFTNLGA